MDHKTYLERAIALIFWLTVINTILISVILYGR